MEMVKSIDEKKFEEKEYLICIIDTDYDTRWMICIGRVEAYEYIKENVDEYTDFESSFVLVENVKLSGRVSIPKFVKRVKEQENIIDDFSIEEITKGNYSDEYVENDVEEQFYQNNNKLSMSDILNKSTSFNNLN